MNVSEDRRSAQCAYGTAGRDKGERRQNDLIAGSHAAGTQRQYERIGAGADAHAMVHAAELCDFRFQCGAFAAQNKLLRRQNAFDRFADFSANGCVLCGQIELRNRFKRSGSGCIGAHEASGAAVFTCAELVGTARTAEPNPPSADYFFGSFVHTAMALFGLMALASSSTD